MNIVDCPVAKILTVVAEQAVAIFAEARFSSIHNFLTGVSCVRVLTNFAALTGTEVLE
jgi:hypothetical protein